MGGTTGRWGTRHGSPDDSRTRFAAQSCPRAFRICIGTAPARTIADTEAIAEFLAQSGPQGPGRVKVQAITPLDNPLITQLGRSKTKASASDNCITITEVLAKSPLLKGEPQRLKRRSFYPTS